MRAFTLQLDGTEDNARRALGSVVCARVRAPNGKRLFEKGQAIGEADLPALLSAEGVLLSLIMPGEGDLHEDNAAMRLGRAAAGQGIEVTGPVEARARLVARHRGLLQVDTAALQRMNSLSSVSIFTLFGGQPVDAGTVVAEAKVTPLLVPASEIEKVEASAEPPPVSVLPFKPVRAAALVRERVGPAQARRVAESLAAKLEWFGSTLGEVRYLPLDASPEAIAAEMRDLLKAGADLLLATGGSASDPADPLLTALAHLPAETSRAGIPAHPGSMLWVAHAGQAPILGVPSCGMFSYATALDLVLPLLLAGAPLTDATLASLGHGGLLQRGDRRFPHSTHSTV